MTARAGLDAVICFYETLTPAALDRLSSVYDDNARFKDPFNDVSGIEKIKEIFEHMFQQVDAPRFEVLDHVLEGNQAFLVWKFFFRTRGRSGQEIVIAGTTHLRFSENGKVMLHRDYWDAAEELYEKIPFLGALMRWLKKQART